MRNDYGIAAMLLLLYAFFYLCYMNLEGRQGEGAGNTNEPRPVSSLVSEDSPCKCRTSLRPQITDAPTIPLQETTCSEYSYLRGGKQKVVSFSFYERSKNSSVQRILSGKVEGNVFLEGLAINIAALPRLYPGQLSVSDQEIVYNEGNLSVQYQGNTIFFNSFVALTTIHNITTVSRAKKYMSGVRVRVEAVSRPLPS